MTTDALLTPTQVVRYLTALGQELDTTVKMLKAADEDAAMKRSAADTAESMAFVEATGSMELRKHQARLQASSKEYEAVVAEALVRHLKAQLRSLETRIDIGRSYGAVVRAELNSLGYTQP